MIEIKVKAVKKPAALSRKSATKAIKQAWADLGRMWHEQVLPKKFKDGAAREYGFRRRSRTYNKRKERRFGHQRPLEWTGRLKRQVLSSRRVSSIAGGGSGQGGRARVVISGPRYLQRFRTASNQPDLAAELRAVSPRDEKKLTKAMDKLLTAELNKETP